MPNSHSFTVTAHGGLLRVLQTKCFVSQAFDLQGGGNLPARYEFDAIWDTGATASVITQRVVDACGLQPVGMIQVHGVNSTEFCEVYLVNIAAPNNVTFPLINVSKATKLVGADVLIGMDIITAGDFSITNKDGQTIFSFRVPSQIHVDYVKEHHAQGLREKFQHGGSKKNRKHHGKKFGANK